MPSLPDKQEPRLLAPDNSLRKKIGMNVALSDIFTPEKVKDCQDMLDQAHTEFARELEEQINAIGNEYMKAVDNPAQAKESMEKAADIAFVVKKRMESLNFVFGYHVAQSLSDYMQEVSTRDSDSLLVVCKHIAVLNIILKDGIKGDGGSVGREMLANLKTLIEKTRK